VLVGHHGIFSLTPVWLLSVAGALIWLCRKDDRRLQLLAAMIVVLSVVCVAFYLTRPQVDCNYGGMTCGLRWMFWFAPLWLLLMLPATDALSTRRWTRALALALLIVSVLSVAYPTWTPWSDPWIDNYLRHAGWG
jgi:hypothetical protein